MTGFPFQGLDLWIFLLKAVVGTSAACHALINKRRPRAAMGWVAICLALPLSGSLLYFFFGINRIRTRAQALRAAGPDPMTDHTADLAPEAVVKDERAPASYHELVQVSKGVTGLPLLAGNRIEILYNGEETFPAMLEAIHGARRAVYLTTYIFESNATGRAFVDALASAQDRGVDVRVIIDGFGELYAKERVSRWLHDRGVQVARFLPPRLIPPMLHVNLRNHRKILVVDNEVAFTGGMNLGDRHLADRLDNPRRVVDVHFRLRGPIVAQIEQGFRDDWAFARREPWEEVDSAPSTCGTAVCRAILDGPDDPLDRLYNVYLGAVSAAQHSIRIMTPYFVPPRELIGALQSAALRGIDVTVVLPELNNLPVVHWASRNMLWELLQHGVDIAYQPPPFVHSKLFVVDDHYVLLGSANLDPRSLRLNFELNIEVFDLELGHEIASHILTARAKSRPVTLEEVDSRPFWQRLRDGLAWLFAPYL